VLEGVLEGGRGDTMPMLVRRAGQADAHLAAFALVVVLALGLVTTTHGSAGLATTAGGLAGVRGLGLRGGRALEQETRRKAYDENTVAADVILKDWKKKITNPPSALETLLAETLLKQSSVDSMKILKYLHIMSVREVTIPGKGERAVVIFVPFIEIKDFRKLCPDLIETLEDQLKAHVFLVAHRRIIRKERRGKALYKQKRPMSRTISKVHEAYLEDIIYPQDVVGQKSVYEVGVQKPTIHVYLDPAERATTEHKMEAFKAVYENLTGKKVVFDYLIYAESSELIKQRTPNRYPCDTAGFLSYSEVKPAPLSDEAGPPPAFADGLQIMLE